MITPAGQFAKDKSMTERRSRSAVFIEGYLVKHSKTLQALMEVDEARMRLIAKDWPISPFEQRFRTPLQIGSFALLAYPGTLLETVMEDETSRAEKTRLLIKVTVAGTIFNLVCMRESGDDFTWNWESQAFLSDQISAEALEALKQAVEQLIEVEIPAILARVKQVPA